MRTVVVGPRPVELEQLIQRRRALGQDLYDELWNGDYHMNPAPHPKNAYVDTQVVLALHPAAQRAGLLVHSPINVGTFDNYRVPDLALLREPGRHVFLPTAAMVVEVLSPKDETYDKFPHYFACGVEEILVIGPMSRNVEWYVRGEDAYVAAAGSALLDLDAARLTALIDWPD